MADKVGSYLISSSGIEDLTVRLVVTNNYLGKAMPKPEPWQITVKQAIILGSVFLVFSIIYFAFILPAILSNIPTSQIVTRFSFPENEWFESKDVHIIDQFRSDRVVANDELFYQITYTNKRAQDIVLQPVLQVMHGGKIVDELTDSPLIQIASGESHSDKIRFFVSTPGENQIILRAGIINGTTLSRINEVTETINISVFSQEENILIQQNETDSYNMLIALFLAFLTALGLIATLWYYFRQLKLMREQNESSAYQFQRNEIKEKREQLKKHFRILVDDYIAKWQYVPASEGEILQIHDSADGFAENLEEIKKHLRSYPEIWQLYTEAPALCKSRDNIWKQINMLKVNMAKALQEKLTEMNIQLAYSTPEDRAREYSPRVYDWIIEAKTKEDFAPQCLLPHPTSSNPKEYEFAGKVIGDLENTWKFASAVGTIMGNQSFVEETMELNKNLKKIDEDIDANSNQFNAKIRNEIVKRVKSADGNINGTCGSCIAIYLDKRHML